MTSSSSTPQQQQDEIDKLRNELAMAKQDIKNMQIATATAVTFLRSIGGQLFRINILQSQAQGITAEMINGIEKVIANIPGAQQQQQQQQQQPQQPQ